jgi:hypothetical protein
MQKLSGDRWRYAAVVIQDTAEAIDEHFGHQRWVDGIEWDRILISEPDRCLGRLLFGSYEKACAKLSPRTRGLACLPIAEYNDKYRELWIGQAELRAEGSDEQN